jgi:hypothetical protein
MALKERKIYPKFNAEAKGGRLFFEKESEFSHYLLSIDSKPLEVIVKPKHKDRSRQEEKFYHAVVVRMIAEAMGIEDQDAHEMLRGFFLSEEESRQIETPKGPKMIRFERILSTTELSDKAYREYWQKCIRWAALPTQPEGLNVNSGLELYIPEPNEVDYQNW